MSQKGFINIILLVVIVALIGAGVYFVSTKQITLPILTPSPRPTPTPISTPTPNHTNWDSNKEYFYYYFDKKIPLKFVGMKDGYPHFVTQDSTKAEVLLTDEFIVKIKTGKTREDLEILNRKYNISIVKNMYGTNDQFILTIKSDPSSNALDMANLYHNQTIIEWADPNFIQLSARPL